MAAEWVSTKPIGDSLFEEHDGIRLAPGSPYKIKNEALWAIRHARLRGVPCFSLAARKLNEALEPTPPSGRGSCLTFGSLLRSWK